MQKRTSIGRVFATFPFLDNQAALVECAFPVFCLPIWNTGRVISPIKEGAEQVWVLMKNSKVGLQGTYIICFLHYHVKTSELNLQPLTSVTTIVFNSQGLSSLHHCVALTQAAYFQTWASDSLKLFCTVWLYQFRSILSILGFVILKSAPG